MGWRSRYGEPVDPHVRLCRFCKRSLETPKHAILMCKGHRDLRRMRDAFWAVVRTVSEIQPPLISPLAAVTFRVLIMDASTVHHLAELEHRVVQLFDGYLPRWPELE